MCTVTFIPQAFSGFVLTSNRDEAPDRHTIPPEPYDVNGRTLLFPKDKLGGGTWFGISNRSRLICLLNGGFTAHVRESSYRMSRGRIVTDLLTEENAIASISNYDFNGIEPFTIVMVDWSTDLQLYELVWDGIASHLSEKPIAPHIWSSSLLYSDEVKKKREMWFSDFIFNNLNPSEIDLLKFHKTTGEGDLKTNLIMDRGFVKTKSITQFSKSENALMRYEDLQSKDTVLMDISSEWEITPQNS